MDLDRGVGARVMQCSRLGLGWRSRQMPSELQADEVVNAVRGVLERVSGAGRCRGQYKGRLPLSSWSSSCPWAKEEQD